MVGGDLGAQPIDNRGLGGAQGYPIKGIQLQCLIKLGGPMDAVFVELLATIVFGLEGEFTANRAFMLAISPDGDGGLGPDAMSKTQGTDIDLHLLNREVVDQGHPVVGIGLRPGQGGKGPG